jgi:hypothetical protein
MKFLAFIVGALLFAAKPPIPSMDSGTFHPV